jgi:hypothetical protein
VSVNWEEAGGGPLEAHPARRIVEVNRSAVIFLMGVSLA